VRRRVEAFNQDKEKTIMMNKEIFEANWDAIRKQITAKWSLIVEYDLKKVDKAEVKYEKMNTMLRVKYGLTHLKAREEISKLWAEHESKNRIKV
jgi:hypothetical protein